MDAPPSRYRVIEKDGRLIVIDNSTGRPASTTSPIPPPSARPGGSPSPVAPAPGRLDSLADSLLRRVVREWDSEGRAVIHWNWQTNGKDRRWDARLDQGQQRRLGRALVALLSAPIFIMLVIFSGGLFLWLAFFIVPAIVWGFRTIGRIQRETGGVKGG